LAAVRLLTWTNGGWSARQKPTGEKMKELIQRLTATDGLDELPKLSKADAVALETLVNTGGEYAIMDLAADAPDYRWAQRVFPRLLAIVRFNGGSVDAALRRQELNRQNRVQESLNDRQRNTPPPVFRNGIRVLGHTTPTVQQPMTELFSKLEISKLFGVGKNAAVEIITKYHAVEVAGKFRFPVAVMPPKYHAKAK
jgi:hypothetical protein